MNVEFRKSFEKDLRKIRDTELLERIRSVIEKIEAIATKYTFEFILTKRKKIWWEENFIYEIRKII